MSATYDEHVGTLARAMLQDDDADDCAAMAIEAAIEVLITRHDAAWTFNLFAGVYDKLAEMAARERDRRIAALRRNQG